jgi:mono/diheme cytochrome c family protein
MANDSTPHSAGQDASKRLFGLIAEFETTDELLAASERVRDAGYTKWDTHSPFPVHGIDEAMGIRRTILPLIVLVSGVVGALTGLGLQVWVSAYYYPLIISGKPYWSIPAFIPVTFELTVLFSGLAAVFGMFILNGLPALYHGVFNSSRLTSRMTTDQFYISIEAADPRFNLNQARGLLESTGSKYVEVVEETGQPSLPPCIRKWFAPAAWVAISLALVPPAVVYLARSRPSETTRLQLIWDMDQQPKFRTQSVNPLFADGRAMRSQVPGTVARGEAFADSALYQGLDKGQFAVRSPLPVTGALLKRGQKVFNIYCSQCHGMDGYGAGAVAVRAERPGVSDGWVPPLSMHEEVVRTREDGHLFNTITNGIRTMPAYGDQIRTEDRWAVVAYVRALQRSQRATIEDVPAENRGALP